MFVIFFFQAEDDIRDLVRSRGLGDVYKGQGSGSGRPGGSSWLPGLGAPWRPPAGKGRRH